MEKLRSEIQQLEKQYMGDDAPIIDYENLKVEINNLLHMYLPKDIAVGQVEALAIAIHDVITNPENYLSK